jgi:glycine betaine catabolism B
MRATITHIEKVTPSIYTYWLRPEYRVRFDAGQFIEIYVPHSPVDSRGDWREFSLSSSPSEAELSITTNFFENGSSFKQALQGLVPGTEITFKEPMGDFVLPKDQTIPLVFVAAGLGTMPYVSMVKWLKARDEQRPIQLIHSVSKTADFLFDEVWQDYSLEFVPIVTRPDPSWDGITGRLDTARLLELVGPISNKLIYLAGPQSLIEPMFNNLLAAGIPRSQLLLDYYPGY